jgi:hypothetical protein
MNAKLMKLAGLTALVGALAGGWSGAAQAQRAQVLVLGTAHLERLEPALSDAALAPLIARLAAFRPDIIAIENLPAESCDTAARHPAAYDPQAFATYCPNLDAARRSTGLDVPAALADMNRLLAQWPASPRPAQRRQLAAVALSAGETGTAMLQWQQLPAQEQREGDGIDAALLARLRTAGARTGEVARVAVPVAQRLSLARLHAMDDHSGDNIAIANPAAYGQAIQKAWNSAEAPMRIIRERESALVRSQDALAFYRHLNDPAVLRVTTDSDFAAAAAEPSPERYGRIYVGAWETRNLRMAANIRAAFRERPDARVLVIVGSSHKPILDRLLGMLDGVDIVDAANMLR